MNGNVVESSPYSPGAGTLPPILAGRDRLMRRLMVGLNDVAAVGRARTQDVILVGPRGVGKTVAMSVYAEQAKAGGFEVINLQAVSGRTGLVPRLPVDDAKPLPFHALRADLKAGAEPGHPRQAGIERAAQSRAAEHGPRRQRRSCRRTWCV